MRIDFIQAAGREMDRLGSGQVQLPAPLDARSLAEELGQGVRRCELWMAKWNNRLYRVELVDGRRAVAKQVCTQPLSELVQEHAHLVELAVLAVPGLRVAQPIALMPKLRTLLVEFAPGRSLAEMIATGAAALPDACARAGQLLGRLHAAWVQSDQPAPGEAWLEDLQAIPGGLPGHVRPLIRRALKSLAGLRIPVGQPYLDFNPRNLVVDGDRLTLIDPPAEQLVGPLLWDYATFTADLCREVWKARLFRPWRRGRLDESVRAFAGGYVATFRAGPIPSAVVKLFELQRVGQLLVQRLGQFRLVLRPSAPVPRASRRLRGLGLAILSLGLLGAQKRCLCNQLSSDVGSHEHTQGYTSPALAKPVLNSVGSVPA